MGQHPRNVWPILAGYLLLYLVTLVLCRMDGREIAWTISTQGYINGVAFATGLCPIVGRYGIRAGLAAGFMCASMCTATSALHGGLVLYNGGFTARDHGSDPPADPGTLHPLRQRTSQRPGHPHE